MAFIKRPTINTVYASDHPLGKMISNMYPIWIDTEDGEFKSIEAYWHWLNTPAADTRRERLRTYCGYKARDQGKALMKGFTRISRSEFRRKIAAAIELKVAASRDLQRKLRMDPDRVLVHEFKWCDQSDKYRWWLDLWEEQRTKYTSSV